MILKDKGNGVTEESLDFFRAHRENLGKIVKVEMINCRKKKYPLRLTDNNGNEIWLSGCDSGYEGEGPLGTFKVLKELGLLGVAGQTLILNNASFGFKT